MLPTRPECHQANTSRNKLPKKLEGVMLDPGDKTWLMHHVSQQVGLVGTDEIAVPVPASDIGFLCLRGFAIIFCVVLIVGPC